MQIELKNIVINQRLSEETICFSADIFIDGIKAGQASNRGHGGCTDYHHLNTDTSRMLIKEAEKFCNELPAVDIGLGGGRMMNMNLEHYIDDILYKYDNEKKQAKDFEKGICFGVRGATGYKIFGYKGMKISKELLTFEGRRDIAKLIADVRTKLKPNEEILNTNLGHLLR
jgi:hypothetical protein